MRIITGIQCCAANDMCNHKSVSESKEYNFSQKMNFCLDSFKRRFQIQIHGSKQSTGVYVVIGPAVIDCMTIELDKFSAQSINNGIWSAKIPKLYLLRMNICTLKDFLKIFSIIITQIVIEIAAIIENDAKIVSEIVIQRSLSLRSSLRSSLGP